MESIKIIFRCFGRKCLSMFSYNRFIGSYPKWKCLRCYNDQLYKNKIFKTVNKEIDLSLKEIKLENYRNLFFCIELSEIKKFQISDLIELGLDNDDADTLFNYLKLKQIDNEIPEIYLPKISSYSEKDLVNLDYISINSLTPSCILYPEQPTDYKQTCILFYLVINMNEKLNTDIIKFQNMFLNTESDEYKKYIDDATKDYIKMPEVKVQKPFGEYRIPKKMGI